MNFKETGNKRPRKDEYEICLSDFSKEEKKSLYHNFSVLIGGMPDTVKTIDQAISFFAKSNITVEYGYYAFEGEFYVVTVNPVLLFANFFDLMCSGDFESIEDMSECMLEQEVLGGDFLTSGDYDRVKIKLSNGKIVIVKIFYTAKYE